jgi:hypothetical protein
MEGCGWRMAIDDLTSAFVALAVSATLTMPEALTAAGTLVAGAALRTRAAMLLVTSPVIVLSVVIVTVGVWPPLITVMAGLVLAARVVASIGQVGAASVARRERGVAVVASAIAAAIHRIDAGVDAEDGNGGKNETK